MIQALRFGSIIKLIQPKAKDPNYFDLNTERSEVGERFDAYIEQMIRDGKVERNSLVFITAPKERLVIDGQDIADFNRDVESSIQAAKDKVPHSQPAKALYQWFNLYGYGFSSERNRRNAEHEVTQTYAEKAQQSGQVIDLDAQG